MVLLTENGARRGPEGALSFLHALQRAGPSVSGVRLRPRAARALGAARMLLHAGVDRFAMTQRLEALAPSQVEHLEAQYATLWAGSGASDVMALFAVHGLTVETWTVECNAWGQAMIRRPDLAMRFGALMAAPWG